MCKMVTQQNPQPLPVTLTRRELADRWKCDARTVDRLIRNGEFKAIRLGRAVRITLTEILRFESGE